MFDKLSTKTKGDIVELKISARLLELGFVVLKPFGDNAPYDLVTEKNSTFYRIQCKCARIRKGSVVNYLQGQTHISNTGLMKKRSYDGQVDYYGLYCPDIDQCFMLPYEHFQNKNCVMLRWEPSKNNQIKGITLAEQFRL